MFLSVANGVGSGILMTLGADLAPKDQPAPFLGAWRFSGDAGSAIAPLVVSLLTAVVSIAFASGVLGFVGLAGAVAARALHPSLRPQVPPPAHRIA